MAELEGWMGMWTTRFGVEVAGVRHAARPIDVVCASRIGLCGADTLPRAVALVASGLDQPSLRGADLAAEGEGMAWNRKVRRREVRPSEAIARSAVIGRLDGPG